MSVNRKADGSAERGPGASSWAGGGSEKAVGSGRPSPRGGSAGVSTVGSSPLSGSASVLRATVALTFFEPPVVKFDKGLTAVPVTRLYDRGNLIAASEVLAPRLDSPHVTLSPEDADKLGAAPGGELSVKLNGVTATVAAKIDNSLPAGVVLVPRSLGLPISGPAPVTVKAK